MFKFQKLILWIALFSALALVSPSGLAQPWVALDCDDFSDEFDCAPVAGGSSAYAIIGSPSTFNPVTAADTASSAIYDPLFGTASNSEYATLDFGILSSGAQGFDPRAAAIIESNEDATVITYTLRDGLKYASGETATTDDVLYWFHDVTFNPNLPNSSAAAFTCPDGNAYAIEALSATQLTVSCSAPFRTFTSNAGAQLVISKQMALDYIDAQNVPTEDGVTGPQATQEFMGLGIDTSMLTGGLGHFVVTEFISDQVIRFVRNANFYGMDSNGTQLPYLDEYETQFFPTNGQNLRLSAFLNGQIDLIDPRPADISTILSQAGPGFNVNPDINDGSPDDGTVFTTPNFDDPNPDLQAAHRNVTVRRALSLAIDRTASVFNVLLGVGTPQYVKVNFSGETGETFFNGRTNTCQTFIDVGLATEGNCVSGTWNLESGLILQVNKLPNPNSTPEALEHLSCLVDYDSCVATAALMLDSVGIVDTDGDGIRNIPANFDGLGNPGANYNVQIFTNDGNDVRSGHGEVICGSWTQLGINCQSGTKAFSTLVSELLSGTFSGFITIGLTGGDPAGSTNTLQCGAALYFFHISCDPQSTGGLTQQETASAAIEAAFDEGFAATTLEGAQAGFDKQQIAWLQGEPYFHLAQENDLFGVRSDRLCNHGRDDEGNTHLKFRVDFPGNEAACTTN